MEPVLPQNTPEGLAYTPAFVLNSDTQIKPLGLISPKRNGFIRSSISEQTRDCLLNLSDALAALGPQASTVKITRFMTDVREIWSSQPELDRHFGSDLPTSTLIEVSACSEPGVQIELDLWAAVPKSRDPTGRAGSQSILSFADADAGTASGSGLAAELDASLDALSDRLSAAGASPDSVFKLTLYLADMRHWPMCREILLSRYPSRSPVVVPIAVPKVPRVGSAVMVEAAFMIEDMADARASLDTSIIALSGQPAIPVFVGGMALDTYKHQPDASVAAQTRVSLRNLENILTAAESDWGHVFKTTWYVTDVREWPQIEEAAHAVFGRSPPCPTVVEVSKLVAPAVRVEPDIWAVTNDG